MILTIEEKTRALELLEKQLETAETEEEIMIRQAKEADMRAKNLLSLKEERKKVVFEYFKTLSGRDMTEEEYKDYIKILESPKTRRYYNLKNFIEGDLGDASDEEII